MNTSEQIRSAPSRTLASVVIAMASLSALAALGGCERRATDPGAPTTGGATGGAAGGTTTTPPPVTPPASAASQ